MLFWRCINARSLSTAAQKESAMRDFFYLHSHVRKISMHTVKMLTWPRWLRVTHSVLQKIIRF